MFASDDVVFAWAIGKALLIVIVSFGILVYAAWAVTWPRKNAAHVGIPKDSVEGARRIPPRTSAEDTNDRQGGEPTVAA